MDQRRARDVIEDAEQPEAERVAAARFLGDAGAPSDVDALLRVYGHADGELAAACRSALIALDAYEQLVVYLHNGLDHQRLQAAKQLVRLGDKRAAPALLTASQDLDAGVRTAAYLALSRLPVDDDTVGALERGLTDSVASVRAQAAHAVGQTANRRLAQLLVDALEREEDDVTRVFMQQATRRLEAAR